MTSLVISLVSVFALLAFAVQLGMGRRAVMDMVNISLLLGLIAVGCIAYVVTPTLITEVVLVGTFSPHAYNLLLWPCLALLVLRPRFSAVYILPLLVALYAIDELVWNGLAVAYFWGQWDVLGYVFAPSWHLFILALCLAGAVGYLVVRPSIRPNVGWVVLGAYGFFWAWLAGFPVLAVTNAASLSFAQTAYRLVFEVLWQLAFWGLFVFTSVKPRHMTADTELFLPRPSVG